MDRSLSQEPSRVLRHRIVTGAEREQMLGSKRSPGFDLSPYRDLLATLEAGEIVAVEVQPGSERREKMRFSRVAKELGKRLRWLPTSGEHEITMLVDQRPAA